MFHDLLKPIARELSGKRAWLDVSRLWHFRNTVCTPSLREACRFCVERFRENGVANARVVPYAADGKTEYGETVIPMEWEPRSATLSVVKPEDQARRVTSLEENALALMSRSAATPKKGIEAQLVVLDDGTKPEHYEGVDVKGNIVMTARQGSGVAAQAKERGAIGVISDTIDRPAMPNYERPLREPFDGPDAVQWNCLPGSGPTADMFGFVLSPRQGQRLRQLAKESQKPVVLRAHVDARRFKGHSDVVDAVVKGSGPEELWVLAHISEPGAYDNASGLALSLEIARTLQALTQNGTLPPMKRSVRFLFSTEVSGFIPYLEQYRSKLPKVVAGLCVDSAGVDMGKIGGEFIIFRSPDYAPSYIEDLLAEITEELVHMRADWFGDNNYSLFPWRHEPFWGNDAFIIDPYFDVPTAQLSCWPYRYYHTSMDMPEYISPDNLARSGVLCATFLHFLAGAGEDEAAWLSALTAGKAKTRIADALREEAMTQTQTLGSKATRAKAAKAMQRVGNCARYHATIEAERARQPLSLSSKAKKIKTANAVVDAITTCAEAEEAAAQQLLQGLAGISADRVPAEPEPDAALVAEARSLVPCRNSWRVPADAKLPAGVRRGLDELRKRKEAKDVNFATRWPWADGRRNVHEIWELMRYKHPCDLGVLVDYFKLMARGRAVDMAHS